MLRFRPRVDEVAYTLLDKNLKLVGADAMLREIQLGGKLMKKKVTTLILAAVVAFTGVVTFGTQDIYATSIPKPGKVTGVKVTGSTVSTISLSWKKVSGAKGYAVYRNGKLIVRTKALKHTDVNLADNHAYAYKIRAYKTKSVKKMSYYNSKTKKWQFSKPAAGQWKGKKKKWGKQTQYIYGAFSAQKKAKTKAKPITYPALDIIRAQARNAINQDLDAFLAANSWMGSIDHVEFDATLNTIAQKRAEQMAKTKTLSRSFAELGGSAEQMYMNATGKSQGDFGLTDIYGSGITSMSQSKVTRLKDYDIESNYWISTKHYSNIGVGYSKGYIDIIMVDPYDQKEEEETIIYFD